MPHEVVLRIELSCAPCLPISSKLKAVNRVDIPRAISAAVLKILGAILRAIWDQLSEEPNFRGVRKTWPLHSLPFCPILTTITGLSVAPLSFRPALTTILCMFSTRFWCLPRKVWKKSGGTELQFRTFFHTQDATVFAVSFSRRKPPKRKTPTKKRVDISCKNWCYSQRQSCAGEKGEREGKEGGNFFARIREWTWWFAYENIMTEHRNRNAAISLCGRQFQGHRFVCHRFSPPLY